MRNSDQMTIRKTHPTLTFYSEFNSFDTVTLVNLIGNEKIEKIVSDIRRRSQVLQDECIDETQQMINDEGVIWPTLKENRATNITCWTSTRGKLTGPNLKYLHASLAPIRFVSECRLQLISYYRSDATTDHRTDNKMES